MSANIEQARKQAEAALTYLRSVLEEPVLLQYGEHVSIEVRPYPADDDRVNVCHDEFGFTTVNYTSEGVILDVVPQDSIDVVHTASIPSDELISEVN